MTQPPLSQPAINDFTASTHPVCAHDVDWRKIYGVLESPSVRDAEHDGGRGLIRFIDRKRVTTDSYVVFSTLGVCVSPTMQVSPPAAPDAAGAGRRRSAQGD